MAKGKKRRRVTWRATTLAHAFFELAGLSACGAFRLADTRNWDKEEKCRACEIVVGQTW